MCVERGKERERGRKEVGFRSGTFMGKWKTRFDHFIWPSCPPLFFSSCLVLLSDLPLWEAVMLSQKKMKTVVEEEEEDEGENNNTKNQSDGFSDQFNFPSSRCSVTFLFVQPCKREPIKLLALLAVNNFMVNDAMMNGFHVAGSCPPHTAERDKDRGRVKVERERENQQ